MTETATETTTAPAEETKVEVWTPPNDVARAIFGEIVAQSDEYNTLQKRVDAATGDVTPLLEDLRRTSDDEKIVSLRTKYDDLVAKSESVVAQMNAYIQENLLSVDMTPEEIEAAQTTLGKIRADIKAGVNFLTSRFPGAESAVPTLVGTKTRKSSAGSGEGGRKPRVSTIYVNGAPATAEVENQKTKEKRVVSTFTIASKMLGGMPVPEIHKAYFEAAGTTDLDAVPDSVEFAVTYKETNYMVRVDK